MPPGCADALTAAAVDAGGRPFQCQVYARLMMSRAELNAALADLEAQIPDLTAKVPEHVWIAAFAEHAEELRHRAADNDRLHAFHELEAMAVRHGLAVAPRAN